MSEYIPFEKVAGFMAELRDVGFEANHLIRRAIGEEMARKRQFIIAMLVSKAELLNNDFRCITEYGQDLLKCNDNERFQASQRYIFYNRIITLLNSPWDQTHGEARLLDPDGTILSEVLQQQPSRKENYLDKLRDNFHLEFGNDEKPIILIFSYFIPCTLENNQCAKVINEYSQRNSETIFLTYQKVFRDTDSHLAFEQMVGKKVKVVPRKYIESYVNTEIRRLLASGHCHKHSGTYQLPRGWLPEACDVNDSVYKQFTRKTRKIEKRDDRNFEESTSYRTGKSNRRCNTDNISRYNLIGDCDDYSCSFQRD